MNHGTRAVLRPLGALGKTLMRGPTKRIFLSAILFPWELNDILTDKHNNAIVFHFGGLIKLSKIQFLDTLRNLGAPKNWGP